MDLILISLILAIHKLSVPETILAIFREASNIFIEYLRQHNLIRLNNLHNSLEDLCKNLAEKFNIVDNITYNIEKNRLHINVENCIFKNICRNIDKIIDRKPELLEILEIRPCGISILFSTLITLANKVPEIEKVSCEDGNANIIIEMR